MIMFILTVVVLPFVRHDHDPVLCYISEYAVGSGGCALRCGFVALGPRGYNKRTVAIASMVSHGV